MQEDFLYRAFCFSSVFPYFRRMEHKQTARIIHEDFSGASTAQNISVLIELLNAES